MGFEPTTTTLATLSSATELHPPDVNADQTQNPPMWVVHGERDKGHGL
jgi:hypothetical protein